MRSRDLLLSAADYDWVTNFASKWVTGHETHWIETRTTQHVTTILKQVRKEAEVKEPVQETVSYTKRVTQQRQTQGTEEQYRNRRIL